MEFIYLSFHLNSENIKIKFLSVNVKVVRDESEILDNFTPI